MSNYYYKDAAGQEQGPLSIESLKALNLTDDTPVREESQTEWKTAEQIDALTEIPVAETFVTVQEPLAETTTTTTAVPAVAAATGKKSTAMLSWILSLLVLGGVGYYIYQDIEKNKDNTNAVEDLTMTTSSTDPANVEPATTDVTTTDTATTNTAIADTTSTTATTPTPTTTTPTTPTTTTAANTNDKQLVAKQKAEAEKKKQQLLAKQKAEEEKKKLLAAQALAAKQLQMRNNWSSYIKPGALNYQPKGDDGMTAFDVPVINTMDVPLNSVTVRLDYYKKENKDKLVNTETITIYNVPAKSTLSGKGPENKKARKAIATITGVNSTPLHFCYPKGSGAVGDPYFCN